EVEVGLTETLEGGERIGGTVVPGFRQRRLEALKAADSDVHHEFVAVAEMAVGRRLTYAGRARGLGGGEAQRGLGREPLQGRVDQGFLEVAMMIPTAPMPAIRPSHVIGFNMSRRKTHFLVTMVGLVRKLRRSYSIACTAERMRSKTLSQSRGLGWRKRRRVGYQGVSSRARSQRQSGVSGISTKT